jgi:TRAP-type transport system periplasmic protein
MKSLKAHRISKMVCLICLLLLVTLLGSTVACSNGTSTTSTSPGTAATSQTAAQPIKLVFTFFEPPVSSTWTDLYKPMFNEIEKRAEGRVKIEPHFNAELVSLVDSIDAVLKGTVDMAHCMPMMAAGQFPMDDISSLWSYDVYNVRHGRVIWDLHQQIPEMQTAYKDFKALWFGTSGTMGWGTSKKPIRKLEDLKGMKTTPTGAISAERIKALGAVPVSLAPEAVVTSLQTGVIDGLPAMAWALRDLNWGPELHYFTVVSPNEALYALLMNKNKWNNLPADIQKIFSEVGETYVDGYDKFNSQLNKDRTASAPKDFGIEVIELSKDELGKFAAVDQPVRQAFASGLEAKGLPGKKLLDSFSQLEKKYSVAENPYITK